MPIGVQSNNKNLPEIDIPEFDVLVISIKLQSNNANFKNLTDFDDSTCIDHDDFYERKVSNVLEAYTVDLTIITKLDGGLLTVHSRPDDHHQAGRGTRDGTQST